MYIEIINYLQTMSKPLRASLAFVFVSLVNKGIAFITTPIFTRLMSQDEYGQLSIYNSWLTIVTIIATFQFASGVFNKAMIKFKADRDGYTSSMLFLDSLITCTVYIFYLCFQKPLNNAMGLGTLMVSLMFLDILFTTSMSFWSIRNRFEYKYKSLIYITLLCNVIATLISIIFVLYLPGNKAFLRTAGLVITHVIFYAGVYIWIIYKGKKFIQITYWKYSFAYNIPLIPHYLSQQILNQSDRIMIYKICGKSDAAKYSLAYQLATLMQLLTDAIHTSLMPWTYQKLELGETGIVGKRAFQIEVLVGSLSLVFSMYAPEFILILGGESYSEAVYIVPPVAMSVVYTTIYSFFGNIEFYFEKTKLVMVASCIVAASNLILNYIFVPLYGFVAAGYTTLICYIFYSCFHYFLMKNICRVNNMSNPYNGRLIYGVAFIFTLISVFIIFIYRFSIQRYLISILVIGLVIVYVKTNKQILLDK